MIRLLTAALLVASFHVGAQTQVPNVFEEGTPATAAEVNENFDTLESAIDAIPADAVEAVTSADLDMDGNRVLFSNVYSQLADLPSASANHGMFAHVHETGEAYYAHAGEWIQIAKQSSVIATGLSCSTDQIIKWDDTANAWVCTDMRWDPYSWKYEGSTGAAPRLTPLEDGTFYSFNNGADLQFSFSNANGEEITGPYNLIKATNHCFIDLVTVQDTGSNKTFATLFVDVTEESDSESWIVTLGGALAESSLVVDGTYRLEVLGCN